MVQCPGFTTCRRQWCPQIVAQQIPCTTYQPQVVRQSCPVQVCRVVPEQIVENCPVQVCRTVARQVTENIPHRVCRMTCRTVTQRIPYQVCRMVTEQCTRKVPVHTCQMVTETQVQKVPYCVAKQVPFQVTRKVAKCVTRQEPVTYTRMVAKCTPRQVAYEVCRLVPVQECGGQVCNNCGPSGADIPQNGAPEQSGPAGGSPTTTEQSTARPVPPATGDLPTLPMNEGTIPQKKKKGAPATEEEGPAGGDLPTKSA
jgi:hypothetical protein